MKKATRRWLFLSAFASVKLTLGELLATTCFAEADFFTFNFTSVTSNEASLLQGTLQLCIVVDQGASDTVTNGTSLTRFATTRYVNQDVECFQVASDHQRLANDHATCFTGEEYVQRLTVNFDLAGTLLDEYTSYRSFAAACTVVVRNCHDGGFLLDLENFRLLCRMRMLSTSVALQLFQHGVAQRTFREHAFDGFFQNTAREASLQLG